MGAEDEGAAPATAWPIALVVNVNTARLTLTPGTLIAQYFDNSVLTQFDLLVPLEFSVETPDEAAEA
jgi:hypothetical protein